MKMNRRMLLIIFVGALIAGIAGAFYLKRHYFDSMSLSRLNLVDLKGEKVNPKLFVGKPVVLVFWATWCPSCRKELPEFDRVRKSLGDDVQFVAISDEDLGEINEFVTSKEYRFSFYKSDSNLLFYGIRTIPRTFFFDAKGKLVAEAQKLITADELLGYIKQIQ